MAENAEIVDSQTELRVEREETFTDAPQEWTDEKTEDSTEPTDSTEVLCSWENPMTVPQPENVTEAAVETIASAEVLHSWEDPTTAPQPQSLTVSQTAFEGVASTEADMEFNDFKGEVDVSPFIKGQEVTSVSGEGPVISLVAEEEPEEEPVQNETVVLETAERLETEKENSDNTTWITQSEVPCESSEQGEADLSETG